MTQRHFDLASATMASNGTVMMAALRKASHHMQNLPTLESQVAMSSAVSSAVFASGEPSTFFAPASAPDGAPPPIVNRVIRTTPPPILVADDDPDDRFFITRLIGKTGVENPVRTFDDGTEVVNYLGALAAATPPGHHSLPRLLFLDLRMMGLGGFGFLEWARQQKSALSLTVVVLSNSAEPADMARAMELGAHRYLVKYPSLQTFATIVRSVYPFRLA